MQSLGFRKSTLALVFAIGLIPALASGQTGAAVSAATTRLQGLVNDLGQQLDLSFRNREDQRQQRLQELAAALSAWNASARTDGDRQVMENWLRQAIRSSFPGASRTLPPTPSFSYAIATPRASERSVGSSAAAAVEQPRYASTSENQATQNQGNRTSRPAAGLEPVDRPSRDLAGRKSQKAVNRPAPPRTFASHPATAPMVWDDPFQDDPTPARLAKRETRRPTSPNVEINRGELTSRLRGYEEALKAIEGDFVSTASPSAFRLAAWTRELDELAPQYQLLSLYLASQATDDMELSTIDWMLQQLSKEAENRYEQLADDQSQKADAERAVLRGVQRKLRDLEAEFASAN